MTRIEALRAIAAALTECESKCEAVLDAAGTALDDSDQDFNELAIFAERMRDRLKDAEQGTKIWGPESAED